MKQPNSDIGIKLIAGCMVIDGIFRLYSAVQNHLSPQPPQYLLLYDIITLAFIITAIGLLKTQGWARNFAILLNLRFFYWAARSMGDLYLIFDILDLIYCISNLVIGSGILWYLVKQSTKDMYPESPNSQFLVGITLASIGFIQMTFTTSNNLIWLTLSFIGLAIILKTIKFDTSP